MPIKNGISYDFFSGQKYKDINIILIHGTGCNRLLLQPLVNVLNKYNLYFIDLPGHGNSKNTGYSSENYIKSVLEFIKDINNVIIIGHSLGASLTVGILGNNPPTCIGGILASGTLKFKVDKEFMNLINKGIYDKKLANKAINEKLSKELIDALTPGREPDNIMIIDWKIDDKIDVTEYAKNIKVPTIVYAGDNDYYIPIEDTKKLSDTIPNSELIIQNKGTHFSLFVNKENFAEIVEKFINKIINKGI